MPSSPDTKKIREKLKKKPCPLETNIAGCLLASIKMASSNYWTFTSKTIEKVLEGFAVPH